MKRRNNITTEQIIIEVNELEQEGKKKSEAFIILSEKYRLTLSGIINRYKTGTMTRKRVSQYSKPVKPYQKIRPRTINKIKKEFDMKNPITKFLLYC